MTRRWEESPPEADAGLDAFLSAAQAEVELDAAAVRPDFEAMMARLRGDDHEVALTEADAGLMDFVYAAREEAEADVLERKLQGIPSAPAESVSSRRSRTSLAVGWVLGLAAAAAIAVYAIPRAMEGQRGEDGATGGQAVLNDEQPETTAAAEHVEPEPAPKMASARDVAPSVDDVEPEPELMVGPEAPMPEDPPRSLRKKGGRDRLAALDAEAQRLWGEGDLEGAEKVFRQIIAQGRRSRYADLAYGDLFSLARQRGVSRDAEVSLWRAYLKAFPRGRHADDARAGLCRRASGEEAETCWAEYLADFPEGSHRDRAQRAVDR